MSEKPFEVFSVETMESFPPGDNPFRHDHFHMGTRLGKNVIAMHQNFDKDVMKYLILVHVPSGQRIKIRFTPEDLGIASAVERAMDMLGITNLPTEEPSLSERNRYWYDQVRELREALAAKDAEIEYLKQTGVWPDKAKYYADPPGEPCPNCGRMDGERYVRSDDTEFCEFCPEEEP